MTTLHTSGRRRSQLSRKQGSLKPRSLLSMQWHFGMKPHVIGVLYLILFLYSTKTVIRNWEWSNTQEVVGAALRVNPQNARVLVAVGNVLAQQVWGRVAKH